MNSLQPRIDSIKQQLVALEVNIDNAFQEVKSSVVLPRLTLENILYWMNQKEDLEEDLRLFLGEKSEQS